MARKVYQCGASIDERGKATGGKAGNQTKAELRRRIWYLHAKGWLVLRAKRLEVRKAIAFAARRAVPNYNIGYDQAQRYTLLDKSKPRGYDPGLVEEKVECDCSTLVGNDVKYAFKKCGINKDFEISGFRTSNMVARLMATGEFDLLTSDIYCKQPDYLCEGDILVTKTQGHTVSADNDGEYAEDEAETSVDRPMLSKGDSGEMVKTVQKLLMQWHAGALPVYGADSNFGNETYAWVRNFQQSHKLVEDGVVGVKTWEALAAYAVVFVGEEDDGKDEESTVVPVIDKAHRPTLSRGDTGYWVEHLQKRLLLWNPKALPKWGADTEFGGETYDWVKKFQTAKKLGVDGIVGRMTWLELDKL